MSRRAVLDLHRPVVTGATLPKAIAASRRWLTELVARHTVAWYPTARQVALLLADGALLTGNATRLLADFGPYSTVITRYDRAGFPTPKAQLTVFRLALALDLYQRGLPSSAWVGLALNFASPQGFCRSVRGTLGVSALTFLTTYRRDQFVADRLDPLLAWDDPRWCTFDPLPPRAPVLNRESMNAALRSVFHELVSA